MMKDSNASWMRLGICIATIVVAVALAWGRFGHEVEDNTEFRKTDGAKNTEHRIKFEERVGNIERDIGKILRAVEE